MEVAVFILRTGEKLVSEGEQLQEEPRCHLYQPYEVSGKTKLTLSPWLKGLTDEKHFLLNSDSLLTVCEASESLVASYADKVGKSVEDFQASPQPELLNEGEQLPEEAYDYGDDYDEPRYQEV